MRCCESLTNNHVASNCLASNYSIATGDPEVFICSEHQWLLPLYDQIMPTGYDQIMPTGRTGYLLDAGCGVGVHCLIAQRRGFYAVGIDYSMVALRKAKNLLLENGYPSRLVLADLLDPPLRVRPGAFHLVQCLGNTLLMLRSRRDATHTIRRLLALTATDGFLLIGLRTSDLELRMSESSSRNDGSSRIQSRRSRLCSCGEYFIVEYSLGDETCGRSKSIQFRLLAVSSAWLDREVSKEGGRLVSSATTPGGFDYRLYSAN
jgi:SAM-dependent methyltransferase